MKKSLLFLIPVILILSGLIWIENNEPQGVREPCEISARDYLAHPEEFTVILDVRTRKEYDEGHLKDAVLMDYYQPGFAGRIKGLDRDKKYIVYCHSGGRSLSTINLMTENGFGEVCHIPGGIVQLRGSGATLVK